MWKRNKPSFLLLAGIMLLLALLAYVGTRDIWHVPQRHLQAAGLEDVLDELALTARNAGGVRYYRDKKAGTAKWSRAQLADALLNRGMGVVGDLIGIIRDSSRREREKRAAALGLVLVLEMTPAGLGEVVAAFEESGITARIYLAEVLARSDLETAVPALEGALQDGNIDVRVSAIEWLWRTGNKNKTVDWAVATLINIATNEDRQVIERASALTSLIVIGRPWVTPQAVVLGDVVAEEESPVLREYALRALGRLGPEARKVEAAIRTAAEKDPSKHVRQAAIEALERIGP